MSNILRIVVSKYFIEGGLKIDKSYYMVNIFIVLWFLIMFYVMQRRELKRFIDRQIILEKEEEARRKEK